MKLYVIALYAIVGILLIGLIICLYLWRTRKNTNTDDNDDNNLIGSDGLYTPII